MIYRRLYLILITFEEFSIYMIKFLKGNYLPLLVLIFFYFDELFHTMMLINGNTEFSGIKQYGALILAIIVYLLMFYHFLNNHNNKKTYRVLFFCGFFLLLYLLTSLLYVGIPDKYIVYLLVYGSECIPAAYLGAVFAKTTTNKIINWLPFFIIPITFIIGTVGFTVAMAGEMVNSQNEDSGGLNYQTLSYFMAFSFTYSLYYFTYCGLTKSLLNKIKKIFFLLVSIFSAMICLVSGGRGGTMVIVIVSCFILFYYMKRSKINILKFTSFLFIIVCIIIATAIYFDAMETRGMERLTTKMFDANSREGLYKNSINAFFSAPWGNGLGSVFWINGIYSHNMIIDFLAELGILGALFFVIFIFKMYMKLYKYSESDCVVHLMLLVFIVNLIQSMFSGYWMGNPKLFLVCSFIYCYKSQNYLLKYARN